MSGVGIGKFNSVEVRKYTLVHSLDYYDWFVWIDYARENSGHFWCYFICCMDKV